jgi:hypothetical protein
MSKNPKFEEYRFIFDKVRIFWNSKFYKEMYVGGQALPTNIYFLVKFRISKIYNVLDIKLIFLKLWIFNNFNTVLFQS